MADQIAIPTGGRIHVRLVSLQTQYRVSAGGISLPDIVENDQDCECEVLAVSQQPGYELPQWVAERLATHTTQSGHTAELFKKYAAQPREPKVKVGDRVLLDITLATQVPGCNNEFFVEEADIYALVTKGPAIQLISTPTDSAGYRTI